MDRCSKRGTERAIGAADDTRRELTIGAADGAYREIILSDTI